MPFAHMSRPAGGNVRPARFVILQADQTVVEAGVGGDILGIAQASTHNQALSPWDDGFAGVVGSPPIQIAVTGQDEAALAIGATVTAGQLLKAMAGGLGTPAIADQDKAGARALRGGSSGDVIPVQPLRMDVAVAS